MTDLLSLSLAEKVGQLLFIGLPGATVDQETKSLLEEVKPGGVCLFGRNVRQAEQTRKLLDDVRAVLPTPPIISIDQEGGLVDRLRRICTPMPPPRVIRQHGDLAAARMLGALTGEILRILGFNMNFAPVMEVMTPERDLLSNGLYSRSFGRSPGEVLGYTMVYLRGLQSAGIIGCLKHFPGIGAGEVDSHDTMPIVNLTHEDLIAQDLAPYIELFLHRQDEDERVHCVMVSHGGFPRINLQTGQLGGLLEPASLNQTVVNKLLRLELGYNHLVVTDDLEMGAITKLHSIEQASKCAFAAGEDMILICSSVDAVRKSYAALLAGFENGELNLRHLDKSLTRIQAVKNLMQPPLAFDLDRFKELSDEVGKLNRKLDYSYGGKV